MSKYLLSVLVSIVMVGCAPKRINAVVDTLIIDNPAQYEKDREYCNQLALTYDLTDEKIQQGIYYGALGGGTATAAALALGYGAINPVAIPFIAGASILGGAAGTLSTDERIARENIMVQCLSKKGYTIYTPYPQK